MPDWRSAFPVKAGPRVVSVSFVRELWEPEGLPHPPQRGRTIANDNVYMGYANVGSVQIGGPYTTAGAGQDTPSRRAMLVCRPQSRADESCLRHQDPVAHRSPRVPTAGDAGRTADAARRSSTRGDATVGASTPGFSSRSSESWSIPTSCCACIEIGSRHPQRAARRLSDLEVASRLSFFLWSSIPDDRLLDLAERRQLTDSGDPRTGSAPDAGRPASDDGAGRRLRRAVAEPAPARRRRRRSRSAIRPTTTACCRRSSARRSCSSRARCARIAASSDLLKRRLHVRQRTAGPALRNSRRLRQPLPPSHASESRSAGRAARARIAAGDDVVSGSHVAGAARQVSA